MSTQPIPKLTPQEYLRIEREQPYKAEVYDKVEWEHNVQ